MILRWLSRYFLRPLKRADRVLISEEIPPLRDAYNIDELKLMDVIISCQGGDYTTAVFDKLRHSGWNGYWIDAASTLRMVNDAVIILDPINLPVIKQSLHNGGKNYIGGNCTVSLMLMAMGVCSKRIWLSG